MKRRARKRKVFVGAMVAAVLLVGGTAYAVTFTDINGNSHADDINAVAAAGITAGCNQAGDQYCPANPVKRDQMASFLARAAGLTTDSIDHFPVLNARGPRQSDCSYAAVAPEAFHGGPCHTTSKVFSTLSFAGTDTSVAIGADELPVVAYFDDTNDQLKVTHCANTACTAGVTTTAIGAMADGQTSIAIGVDGLPVVSFFSGGLKVAHCSNVRCTTSTISAVLDAAGAQYVSMAIDGADRPVIAYYDSTNHDAKFARCDDTFCSSVAKLTINDPDHVGSDVGAGLSLAIGADGLPALAYYNATDHRLQYVHCESATCDSINRHFPVSTPGDNGIAPSLAIGRDGKPVISYYGFGSLNVVHCIDVYCLTPAAANQVDPGNFGIDDYGSYNSIAIGTDGWPVVSYYEATTSELKLLHCRDVQCSLQDLSVIDTDGVVGQHNAIAISTDGTVVIGYYDETTGNLKVATS